MSYFTDITKKELSLFVELYLFQVGDVTTRYTNHIESITYQDYVYQARPIKRSGFEEKVGPGSKRVTLTLAIDPSLLTVVANAPIEPISVTILRLFINSQSAVILFSGEVLNVTLTENIASVEVEAGTEIFRNRFPRFSYQAACNHMLFDVGCTLLEENWAVAAIASAVNNTEISAVALGGFAENYFTGGHVKFENDIRLITNYTQNNSLGTIIVHVPFDSRLVVNSPFSVWPGCDKLFETCANKFANTENFSGFLNIPSSNPVIWGL